MQSSHTFSTESAVFDERNLVSAGGLVPVLELAEQTGLSRLIGEHVELPSTRVRSGAVNPAGKLTTIIAGMMCGADSIDDANLLRAGGTPRVFDEVYAPSTVGILLREFSFGHANQLAAVARAHLIALAARTPLLAGTDERMFLDIDSLLRPVYGHHKQGASFGHAKIAGRALLRKGLSPLITTLSVPTAAPVIAEAWLRSGKTGSGRGAARQLKQAATTARAIDPDATIMARGDSAFGTKKVIAACLDEQIEFSLTLSRNRRVTTAIQAIDDAAFTPVHYPGAVEDPDTGALISDAEVAETTHTLNYLFRRRGMLTSPAGEAYGFVRSDAELPLPDLELFFGPAPFFDEGLAAPNGHGVLLGAILLKPQSRGRIWLRSADPKAKPAIDPRYLSDSGGADRAAITEGLRMSAQIAAAPALKDVLGSMVRPLRATDATEDALAAAVNAESHTMYHPVGTCRMGADPESVVTPKLQVRGVLGLRVADASVMPNIVRGHTHAASMLIGARAVDLISAAKRG